MKFNRLFLLPIASLFFFLLKLRFSDSIESFNTLVPISILVTSYLFFIVKVISQDNGLKVDIGLFAISYTFLYFIFPILGFYFGGNSFGPLSDNRLRASLPSSQEILSI